VGAELESAHDQMRRECLGSDSGLISDMCTTSRFLRLGGGRGDGEMASEAELNYYVNDWLFIAPSSTADTFGAIAERHMAYKHALAEVGIHTEWMHFYWAAHVHHALKVASGVRMAVEAATDFSLARSAAKSTGRYCRTNRTVALPDVKASVWGGMQRRLCPHAGRISCPWQSHRCTAEAMEGPMQSIGA